MNSNVGDPNKLDQTRGRATTHLSIWKTAILQKVQLEGREIEFPGKEGLVGLVQKKGEMWGIKGE
jgi:hypothetical protein